MFVDLMRDLRRTVSSLFYRAQIGQQQQTPARTAQQRLQYSGPSGAEDTGGAGAARQAARSEPGRGGSRLDPVGVSAAARAGAAGAGGAAGATDPSRLQTNRGDGDAETRQPITTEDEPGRNDPCPCGSGKKYKKCCGAVG
ncbi:MAG: hypothetical protein EA352_09945 [Gemmatimonadales bacterium]|nr:MAG: hypothetical protein EA352_09945 [Gemmatimonadales bacterium]